MRGRTGGDLSPVALSFLPYAVASVFMLRLLWPHVAGLRIPITLYALAIAVMAGLALGLAVTQADRSGALAAAGAALFVVSDAALALDRFVGDLPGGRYLVLSTYWIAQTLIALSVQGA